jgi:Tfp pilus assembly protein PilO
VKAKLASLSPRGIMALTAAGVLLWALLLWLFFVAPKRSEASRVADQVAAAELELAEAQAAAHQPSGAGVQVSDVFRLAKAMPASGDQAGLVLELTRLAAATGVELRSITLQPAAEGAGGATMIPVVLSLGGNYREITKFLTRARLLVAVRRGRLHAKGRLFTVQSLELAQSLTAGFPELDGTVSLSAYVYDGPIVPDESSKSGDQSSELPSSGASAAGGTN